MNRMHAEGDPSLKGGNKVMRKVAALGVALIALAGCSKDAGPRDGSISSPTVASAEIATPNEVKLQQDVQKNFDIFAHAINKATNTNDSRFRVITTPSPQNPSRGITGVDITPDTSLIGTSGEAHYSMYLSGDLDPNTGNVDPTKATSIFIGMDTEKGNPKAGQLYMFGIERVADSSDWEVYNAAESKGGTKDYKTYITGGANPVGTRFHPVEPLTSEQFGKISAQAQQVMSWAEAVAPINYAPSQA